MLLIYGCERPPEGSPERYAKHEAVRAYFRRCQEDGVLLAADPLHGVHTATTVRVRDDEALVTDGPFAETVEQLGGYIILDCRDLDEALRYAALCPMAAEGAVEVRPIMELGPTKPAVGTGAMRAEPTLGTQAHRAKPTVDSELGPA